MRVFLAATTIIFALLYVKQIEETRKKEIDYASLYKVWKKQRDVILDSNLHQCCYKNN